MNYVDGINKILNNLKNYKSKCRDRILNGFTIDNMISKISKIFNTISNNPNKDKIQRAEKENIKTKKELITMYLIAFKTEYKWMCKVFNKNNVDVLYFKKENKKLKGKENPMYEHTLEYKIKHPIVVILRKIGIYEFCKKLIGRGEEN